MLLYPLFLCSMDDYRYLLLSKNTYYKQNMNDYANNNNINIDTNTKISGFVQGLYFITLNNNNFIKTKIEKLYMIDSINIIEHINTILEYKSINEASYFFSKNKNYDRYIIDDNNNKMNIIALNKNNKTITVNYSNKKQIYRHKKINQLCYYYNNNNNIIYYYDNKIISANNIDNNNNEYILIYEDNLYKIDNDKLSNKIEYDTTTLLKCIEAQNMYIYHNNTNWFKLKDKYDIFITKDNHIACIDNINNNVNNNINNNVNINMNINMMNTINTIVSEINHNNNKYLLFKNGKEYIILLSKSNTININQLFLLNDDISIYNNSIIDNSLFFIKQDITYPFNISIKNKDYYYYIIDNNYYYITTYKNTVQFNDLVLDNNVQKNIKERLYEIKYIDNKSFIKIDNIDIEIN